jgi:hypothetical protein
MTDNSETDRYYIEKRRSKCYDGGESKSPHWVVHDRNGRGPVDDVSQNRLWKARMLCGSLNQNENYRQALEQSEARVRELEAEVECEEKRFCMQTDLLAECSKRVREMEGEWVPQNLRVVAFHYGCEDIFVCAVSGYACIKTILEIEDACAAYRSDGGIFVLGRGEYLLSCDHRHEQLGDEGRVEFPAYWELSCIDFKPLSTTKAR